MTRSLDSRAKSLSTKAVREAERAVDRIKKEIKKLGDALETFDQAKSEVDKTTKALDANRKQIAATLRVKMLIETKVDAELARAVERLETDRAKLQRSTEAIEADLGIIHERDRAARDGLLPFIEAREELRNLEKRRVRAKAHFAKFELKAEAMEDVATNVEAIRKAMLAAKEEIAGGALDRAGKRAQELYTDLVQHSHFDQLAVKANLKTAKVDYAFEVSNSQQPKSAREARIVLSDGQLTAAALGLFFALADSTAHRLDLLYVDDPTQNLDHPHKEAMATVIAEISARKQVIVATQDEDFVSLLRDANFEATGVTHHIESWDQSPVVSTKFHGNK